MRELAALADPNRTGQYWILEVVNWAALWCAVGFVSGFLAKARLMAVLGGLVAETLMVLGFYLPLGHVQRFHVLWLAAAIVSGPVMGWLGSLARQDRLLPIRVLGALFVLEPLAWSLLFLLLGRAANPLSDVTTWSEIAIGLIIICLAQFRARSGPTPRPPARSR